MGWRDAIFPPRSDQAELMDDPAVPAAELAQCLADIERVNAALGAHTATIQAMQSVLPPGARHVRVLDVGIGGGDLMRRLVDWGEARGITFEVLGIELTDASIAFGRSRCAGYPQIRIERQDLFELEAQTFDVVHAAQVLHHFPGTEAVRALRAMRPLARYGVVVHDLHRHALSWLGAQAVTRAVASSPLVHHDGPLSVRRAFTRAELEGYAADAGARSVEVRWAPLFRWTMVLRD